MKLVSADWLLPLNHVDIIPNGALVTDGDTLIAVGPKVKLQQEFPNLEEEHFSESVILPGLIVAHCHLDRAGFFERFMIETDSTYSPTHWLLEGLRYLSRTPAATVAERMEREIDHFLENGVTCIGVMAHYEGTFPLMKSKPIRGVVFQEILSGPDKRAQQRFEVALALIDKYLEAKPSHLKIGLGPYAAYLLSRNLLNIISRHAKDNNLPLQMHVAENFAEMEFFFESKGEIATKLFPAIGWEDLPPPHRKTPVQHLEDIGFFNTPLSLVGGYHLSAADFPRLARSLARVVYCPSANRRFKFGQFPLKQLQEQGIPIALGTETFYQTDGFSIWDEMRLALQEGSQPLPTPVELLKMVTQQGATALHFEETTGTLEPGKKADFIVIRKPTISGVINMETLSRELILQTTPSSIRQVVIGGEGLRSKNPSA